MVMPSMTSRPPTPPQDTDEDIEDALAFLNSDIEPEKSSRPPSQHISSSTPPNSSPLRSSTLISNANIIKRVEFLSTPTFHPPANSLLEASSPKSSPARSKLLRPSKSILKLGSTSPLPTPDDSDTHSSYFTSQLPESFAKMLDSTLKQLDSTSKYSRLDAYLAINGALATYEDVPNHQEVSRHMNAFQRLILRDTVLRGTNESTDMQLAAQAFKLAARILAWDDFRVATDANFQASILDRTIAASEQAAVAKPIIKSALGLLAHQDFTTTILTPLKVDRVLTALQTIEERCPGTNGIAIRITIYRRLIRQAPSVMLARIKDWLQHLLNGMLSDISDVRNRAIEVCNYAAMEFGGNASATKALHDLLEIETEKESTRYYEHFTLRLAHFTKSEKVRSSVPMIWSALVLFHRSSKMPIQSWRRFRSWITIMQPCLCSSDSELRCQAHSAWRKLIYVVRPDSTMSTNFVAVLMKPMRTGFERKGADKRSKELRRLALDGYFNLLHYALRPDLTFDSLDFAWDNFVVDTVELMAGASTKGRHFASRILRGLFTPNTGAWNPTAALQPKAILPEDLPRIDARWIRSRLSKILPLVDLVLLPMLESPEGQDCTTELEMWSSLLQSVLQAGAQEVRVSMELKAAIVDLLNAFQNLSTRTAQTAAEMDVSRVQKRLSELQFMAFTRLGAAHLVENFVILEPQTGTAMSAQNPRSAAGSQGNITPLDFVLTYAAAVSSSFVEAVLTMYCSSKSSSAGKVQLISKTWQTLVSRQDCIYGNLTTIWTAVASILTCLIDTEKDRMSAPLSPEALQELGTCKAILSAAFKLAEVDSNALLNFETLTTRAIRLARDLAGEAGPELALVEPLSKAALAEQDTYSLSVVQRFVLAVLPSVSWTQHPQAEGRALKALIGVAGIHKTGSMTLEQYVRLVNQVMCSCYGDTTDHSDPTVALETLRLLCNTLNPDDGCGEQVMQRLAPGICAWVEDTEDRLRTMSETSGLLRSQSWSIVLSLLRMEMSKNTFNKALVEQLLMAGLRSTSLEIVNNTIELWNSTFELQETLKHSDDLQQVLRALNTVAIIRMPRLSVSTDEPLLSLPACEQLKIPVVTSAPVQMSTPQSRVTTHRREASDRPTSMNPRHVERSSTKKLFKSPRIRHDDSQIAFVPIVRMPTLQAQDSQLFTDNQREARDRQHADVQQYQDMSSSPVRSIAPRLLQLDHDRASRADNEALTNIHMDDMDVTSPPVLNNAQHTQEPLAVLSDETTIVVSSVAPVAVTQGKSLPALERSSSEAATDEPAENVGDDTSMDMDLPNVQLQIETEMAASLENTPSKRRAATTSDTDVVLSSQVSLDTTTSKSSQKRKRSKTEKQAEKNARRKVTSSISKSATEQDDDDIGECIVVASSQQWLDSQTDNDVLVEPNVEDEENVTPSTNRTSQVSENGDSSRRRRRRKGKKNKVNPKDDSPTFNRQLSSHVPATDTVSSSQPSLLGSAQSPVKQTAIPASPAQTKHPVGTSVVEQTDLEATDASIPSASRVSPTRTSMGAAGILSLLREALDGFKASVFGHQEERAIDDMLFELRKANYDAGRRGQGI
ncbi:hypothetical protein AMS68_007136 [Peltaster fructicola]|uniref:Telomere-associated protein Rif1 N-terminal domain-containing protein n=1 Tax=Peltaster fructicola TaxID=286661 RepID=A0A6H0Y447_9PEZI|nr:hypothetical protein AMS68_007136 [Peltaster fructicola]